jgi:prephenate dehydrogenase
MKSVDAISSVVIVGAGLIGASIGLALGRRDVAVHVQDIDPAAVRLAAQVGAGNATPPSTEPDLVVVAVPPDHLGQAVVDALGRWPGAVVTDVGSVKRAPLQQATQRCSDLRRYVGSHPMAGSEHAGARAASAALFDARVWAVVPHEQSDPAAIATVERLVLTCGATALRMTPAEHDLAAARVSHLPYLLAVLAAARLVGGPDSHLALAGQGLRDVTRVAGSPPALWGQILSANAEPVAALLREVRDDIDGVLETLTTAGKHVQGDAKGPDAGPHALLDLLNRGLLGTKAVAASATGYPA